MRGAGSVSVAAGGVEAGVAALGGADRPIQCRVDATKTWRGETALGASIAAPGASSPRRSRPNSRGTGALHGASITQMIAENPSRKQGTVREMINRAAPTRHPAERHEPGAPWVGHPPGGAFGPSG
jgi:hypothetical protein